MDKKLIIREIKKYLNIEKDKDFAEYLGIKTSTLSMWYKRNSYDIELLFKKCEFINAEWLLTGEGEMLKIEYQYEAEEKTKNKENVTLLKGNKKGNANGNKRNVKKMLPFKEAKPEPPNDSHLEIIQLLKENKKLVEEKNELLESENKRLSKEVSNLSNQNKALVAENANLQAQSKECADKLKAAEREVNALKKGLQTHKTG